MAQFGTVITNIGLAKIANAQITQETVGIKHMVLGDGNGAYYTLSQSQTSLKREVWRGMIADEQRDPSNPNRIAFSAYIPSTAGGFTIREVGLLDTAGNLIAVSLYPEQYKPQLAEGVSDDLLLHFVLETSNASVVTLAVDPTIVIASRKYVDDKVAGAMGNIDTDLTELQEQVTTHLADKASLTTAGHVRLSNEIDSSSEETAATSKALSLLKAESSTVVVGAYLGDGSVNREINLGFKPKFVLMLGRNSSTQDYGGTVSGGLITESAPTITGYYQSTPGVIAARLTDNGFMVSSGAYSGTNNTASTHNPYRYIAGK